MRILQIICFTLAGAVLALSFKLWLADRDQLATWTRATARVDSTRVVDVAAELPYSIGGKAVMYAVTYEYKDRTYGGKMVDGVWARRSYQRAAADADEAQNRGTVSLLIDPLDPYHLSLKPDDGIYYYRDAWQLALLSLLLLLAGLVLRRLQGAQA